MYRIMEKVIQITDRRWKNNSIYLSQIIIVKNLFESQILENDLDHKYFSSNYFVVFPRLLRSIIHKSDPQSVRKICDLHKILDDLRNRMSQL